MTQMDWPCRIRGEATSIFLKYCLEQAVGVVSAGLSLDPSPDEWDGIDEYVLDIPSSSPVQSIVAAAEFYAVYHEEWREDAEQCFDYSAAAQLIIQANHTYADRVAAAFTELVHRINDDVVLDDLIADGNADGIRKRIERICQDFEYMGEF